MRENRRITTNTHLRAIKWYLLILIVQGVAGLHALSQILEKL